MNPQRRSIRPADELTRVLTDALARLEELPDTPPAIRLRPGEEETSAGTCWEISDQWRQVSR